MRESQMLSMNQYSSKLSIAEDQSQSAFCGGLKLPKISPSLQNGIIKNTFLKKKHRDYKKYDKTGK